MALYLLDTNVFAALSRAQPQRSVERAFARHGGELVTSAVVVHEMTFGIERMAPSRRRAHLERFLAEVVAPLRVLPYGERAAKWHAVQRAQLAARGRTIALADGQIAATAVVHDAVLVTANVTHFEDFGDLSVENWLA